MAYFLCHHSLKSANSMIATLASASPFKLSRFREVHAQALNFSSYNSLVATLKIKPVFFSPFDYTSSLEAIVKAKFGYDCEQNKLEWEKFCEFVFNLYDEQVSSDSVRFARLDFQVIHIPATGFTFPPLTHLPTKYDGNTFLDINDFLKNVVSDPAPPTVSWERTPRAIQNNSTWDDYGHFNHYIEDESGISLADPNYNNHNAVLYFTTSIGGYQEAEDECFSKVLTTGYGSLFLKVDRTTEITITEDHKRQLVGLLGSASSANPHDAPVISFLGAAKFFDVDLLPTASDGHICHNENISDLAEFEPLSYLAGITTKDAIKEYFETTHFDGNYIVPINNNVEVDPNLVESWRRGLSTDNEIDYCIRIKRPSGALAFKVFGWKMAMEISGVHSMIEKAYRDSERYKDFTIQNTTCNQFTLYDTIHLTDFTYIEMLNINCAHPAIISLCDETVVDEICDQLDQIDSLDSFAQLLKSIGVTTLIYNEQIENSGGTAFASVWVGFNDEMEEMVVFEAHSQEHSLADICESLRSLLDLPHSECGVHRSLEYSIHSKWHVGDPDWCGGYYSIIKPFDPNLRSMQ